MYITTKKINKIKMKKQTNKTNKKISMYINVPYRCKNTAFQR